MSDIPKARSGRKGKWGDIFRACQNQGDSFFVPFSSRTFKSFGATISQWNKRLHPWKFVSRMYDKEGRPEISSKGVKGFRVWRSE